MNVGFTGAQEGMTARQIRGVRYIVEAFAFLHEAEITFRHGDCKGADEQFHAIIEDVANQYDIRREITIIGHIPNVKNKRAFCKFDITIDPLPYLGRNARIVQESDILIACPPSLREETRSGTWSTIRYAREKGIPCIVIDR